MLNLFEYGLVIYNKFLFVYNIKHFFFKSLLKTSIPVIIKLYF